MAKSEGSNVVQAAKSAVAAACELGRQRTGQHYGSVEEAVRAGAITDADWCQCLDAARKEYDVEGEMQWETVLGEVRAFVRQHPGCGITQIQEGVRKNPPYVRQAVDCLLIREEVTAQFAGCLRERGHAKFYIAEARS